MASIRQEFDVAATVNQMWDAIRDVGAIHRRLARGFVTGTQLEGETRVVTFADGTVVRELLVDVDDATRRIAYAVIDGAPRHHHASMQVVPLDESRCRVIWIADVLPAAVASRIEGMMRAGAKAMQKTLGHDAALSAASRHWINGGFDNALLTRKSPGLIRNGAQACRNSRIHDLRWLASMQELRDPDRRSSTFLPASCHQR